ncbi:MAG TPA: LuxR C-terminal-related transcriptional regulator [Candidatus Limnocylindrales bacterium]
MFAIWRLVGRLEQQRAVDDVFTRAAQACEPGGVLGRDQAQRAAGVVLVGEAGTGLTRLARESLDRLVMAGCQPRWVAGAAADPSIPFGAIAGLLPGEWRPDGPELMVLKAVSDHFRAHGGQGGVALVVDDAHLLDVSSAALVAQLALARSAFILLTVHRGQPLPVPLAALLKDGELTRIEVPPLTAESIDELIDQTLAGPVDGVTRHRLHTTAGGRPAVLFELLMSGLETGALREMYNTWKWYGRMTASTRVWEVVLARLAALPPDVRDVLEVVSVGEPLPLGVLEHIVNRDTIGAAERSGLLVSERSGSRVQVRLANPLQACAIRDGLAVAQARHIAGRLASGLASTGMRRADDQLRAAVWQLEAGVVTRPEVLLRAARQARRTDLALAEWCARAAVAAGVGAEAEVFLAQILEVTGRTEQAARILAAVPPEPRLRGERATTEATISYWGQGRTEHALTVLDVSDVEEGWDLARAMRAWILLCEGSTETALATATQVLSPPAIGKASKRAVIWASAGGAGAAGALGRLDIAMRIRRQGKAATPVECVASIAMLINGDIAGAREIAEREYRAAAREHSSFMLGIWAMQHGHIAIATGNSVTAQAQLREAMLHLEETGAGLLGHCLTALACAAALGGDHHQARDWLARADAEHTTTNRVLLPWNERYRAWVSAAEGATSEAIERLRAGAVTARDGQPTVEAHLLYDIARLGEPESVAERLGELAVYLGTPFFAAFASAAGGLAAQEPIAQLARAAAVFRERGHLMLAEELLWTASRRHRQLGNRSSTLLLAEQAADLAARREVTHTPLLTFADTDVMLTAREREIVLLAATNTSREIAIRLGIAVSTVNNHLQAAYAKLGVSGRAELADLLRMGD